MTLKMSLLIKVLEKINIKMFDIFSIDRYNNIFYFIFTVIKFIKNK